MAMHEVGSIAKQLARWCSVQVPEVEGEDPPTFYARLRTGRTKGQARQRARRDLAGKDPKVIATELMISFNSIGARNIGVIEIMQTGHNKPEETIDLGSPDGDEPDAGDPEETIEPGQMLGVAIRAIVDTNAQLSDALNQERLGNRELMLEHVKVTGRAIASETMLNWIERNGLENRDAMTAAIEAFGPLLVPTLANLASNLGGKGNKATKGKAETPDARCDRLLIELNDVVDHQPELLKKRKLELLVVGQKLQALFAEPEHEARE